MSPLLILSLTERTLRLRVFAGPNGSGKSTVISTVRSHRVSGRPIDFGIYVNADDIARTLRSGHLSLSDYDVHADMEEFSRVALHSGLVSGEFGAGHFRDSFRLADGRISLLEVSANERLAQIIADFLRKKLLAERIRLSFETVFSHPGKLDFIRQARDDGYKVYLYFVSTKHPDVNVYRVKQVRVQQMGHDVPEDKIRARYYRSMDLMYEAAQLVYQTYFFDNSNDRKESELFAHFKNVNGIKEWSIPNPERIPEWFKTNSVLNV